MDNNFESSLFSDSDSSSDNYCPVGLSYAADGGNISGEVISTVNVFVGDKLDNPFNVPSTLTYHVLLNRAEGLFQRQLEDLDNKKKLKLTVTRKNRKTYVNLYELADQLKRHSDHLKFFILTHLNTKGTISKQGHLVVEGKYLQSEFEDILKNFIELYVLCKSCKNMQNTVIVKQNRLYFLRCNKCSANSCLGNKIEGLSNKDTNVLVNE